jgi:hypothetical protein
MDCLDLIQKGEEVVNTAVAIHAGGHFVAAHFRLFRESIIGGGGSGIDRSSSGINMRSGSSNSGDDVQGSFQVFESTTEVYTPTAANEGTKHL